jgi:hypothetical protein
MGERYWHSEFEIEIEGGEFFDDDEDEEFFPRDEESEEDDEPPRRKRKPAHQYVHLFLVVSLFFFLHLLSFLFLIPVFILFPYFSSFLHIFLTRSFPCPPYLLRGSVLITFVLLQEEDVVRRVEGNQEVQADGWCRVCLSDILSCSSRLFVFLFCLFFSSVCVLFETILCSRSSFRIFICSVRPPLPILLQTTSSLTSWGPLSSLYLLMNLSHPFTHFSVRRVKKTRKNNGMVEGSRRYATFYLGFVSSFFFPFLQEHSSYVFLLVLFPFHSPERMENTTDDKDVTESAQCLDEDGEKRYITWFKFLLSSASMFVFVSHPSFVILCILFMFSLTIHPLFIFFSFLPLYLTCTLFFSDRKIP